MSQENLFLSLWGEKIPVASFLEELTIKGQASVILREMAKAFLFKKSFANFKIDFSSIASKQEIFQNFCKVVNIQNQEQIENFLRNAQETSDSLINKLVYQEEINKLRQVVVTEEIINQQFEQNKALLSTVQFATIRVKEKDLAESIYKELTDDQKDFSDLAKQYSLDDAEVKISGGIRYRPFNSLHPVVAKALKDLQPNEISEIISLEDKEFAIFKLIEIRPVELNDELKANMRNQLFEAWINNQLTNSNLKFSHE
jgi:PPIC-type PPIASE domain